jgi:hypothetical protein
MGWPVGALGAHAVVSGAVRTAQRRTCTPAQKAAATAGPGRDWIRD